MRVTIDWLRSLSVGVKVVAVALSMCALVALLMATTNIAAMRGRIDGFRPTYQAAQSDPMSSTTFTKTANGVTYTRTYVKNADESETEFDVRAKGLWQAYCTLHGI
jgi:hypothetical protein